MPPAGPAPAGVAPELATVWHAIRSAPTGDPFFDLRPADLDRYAPGDIIESRDITWPAVPMVLTSVLALFQRAVLLKFRTTDASGAPSFGTATLLVPFNPWTGSGTRPVLLNATPINALNRRCTPGYVLSHGYSVDSVNGNDFVPSPSMWAASRNYAVVIPDHEGPLMAYAEPRVAGHTMLDTVRAVRNLAPDQFGESRFALTGYSGGAIASYGAAMLAREYAPELVPRLAGAAIGGLPTDYRAFAETYDGTYVSGLLLTITLAMAREHPEIIGRMNHLAQWAAMSPIKEVCSANTATLGVFGIPYAALSNTRDPLHSAVAEKLFQRMSLKDKKSSIPIYIYNGLHDPWMHAADAEALFNQQCALGVPATEKIVAGEHILGYVNGFFGSTDWLGKRLTGIPAPHTCELAQHTRPVPPTTPNQRTRAPKPP
ncbi:lipase family protein [Nocardia sp. JMUB6875]